MITGKLTGAGGIVVINHNTDNTLMTLRYRLPDAKMRAAEDTFKIGDKQFNAGSFIIEGADKDKLALAVTEDLEIVMKGIILDILLLNWIQHIKRQADYLAPGAIVG